MQLLVVQVTGDVIGHVSPVTADLWLEMLLGLVAQVTQKVPPRRQQWNPGLDLLVGMEGAGTLALTRKSLRFLHLEYETMGGFGKIRLNRGSLVRTFQCLYSILLTAGNLGSYGIGRQGRLDAALWTLTRA